MCKGVDLESFDGFRVEAPGICSFPALSDEFCDMLLEAGKGAKHAFAWQMIRTAQEVRHYRESGLPSRAPNSMNNYGLVLNEILCA